MPGSGLKAPLLKERYRPERLIGQGGSSAVYVGHDVAIGRMVAIKLLSASAALDEEQYRREIRLLSGLHHHGIVSIVDAGIDRSSPEDVRPFIVMELVSGSSLKWAISRRRLTSRQVGEIAYDVAEALEYVHLREIVHRDITPSNILLRDYGTKTSRERAQLTDFGIALELSVPQSIAPSTTGTAAYLSPEQALGQELTSFSDIYSLGLVLLECLTRERAYPGAPLPSALARLQRQPIIPHELNAMWKSLISAMVDRDPRSRPNAEEVAAAAREIVIDDGLAARY